MGFPLGPAESGWLGELTDKFEPEITKLKGLAVGTLLSLVRDVITGSAPVELKPQLAELMDNINMKLGGEPSQGNLFKSESASSATLDEGGRPLARWGTRT